jgi:FixJ family two-component response regulator
VHVYDSSASLLVDPDLLQDACIVIDYNIPGMSGIELEERLDERYLHYPIIFVTPGRAQTFKGS